MFLIGSWGMIGRVRCWMLIWLGTGKDQRASMLHLWSWISFKIIYYRNFEVVLSLMKSVPLSGLADGTQALDVWKENRTLRVDVVFHNICLYSWIRKAKVFDCWTASQNIQILPNSVYHCSAFYSELQVYLLRSPTLSLLPSAKLCHLSSSDPFVKNTLWLNEVSHFPYQVCPASTMVITKRPTMTWNSLIPVQIALQYRVSYQTL